MDTLLKARQKLVRNRGVRAAIAPFLPTTPRPDLQRLGTIYGGWWVPTSLLNPETVVYSVGIGGDASFDLELMHRYGCRVWGFDPTPFSLEYVSSQEWPPEWTFDPVGVWTKSASLTFRPSAGQTSGSSSITRAGNEGGVFTAQVEPLSALMQRHGHDRIDLLKMDIEGAEGPVLEDLLASDLRPSIMCIEFDQPEAPWSLVRRIRRILAAGYLLNHVEGWNYTFTRGAG